MSGVILSNIQIIANQNVLSEMQQKQFKQVIVEGLRGKFAKTLLEDTESMLKIVDLWIKYGFLPMDETFCAVDESSGDLLAILLLNNFKNPNPFRSVLCLVNVMKTIGMKKALQIAFNFLELDTLNKEARDNHIVSEIYLVATRQDMRGNGVGTLLMNHVFAYVHSKHQCSPEKANIPKIKLLVFAKNPALRLYEKLGFTQVNSIPTPKMAVAFGEEYDVLVRMVRAV